MTVVAAGRGRLIAPAAEAYEVAGRVVASIDDGDADALWLPDMQLELNQALGVDDPDVGRLRRP